MNDNHYDVIIVGTGAGGATLAYQLAPSGKKILVLERGNFLPREKANWNPQHVLQGAYRNAEAWYDKQGKSINTNVHYYVGGNTKFYGGALFRFRERDFEQVTHSDGVSPEWILKYRDFAPYYTQAEKLYEVHGQRGLDPTEPEQEAYPFPAITHEPHIQAIYEGLKDKNFHPFYLPLSIKLNQTNALLSACIRCDTCDGFPCFLNAKADADINCMRPAVTSSNVTLMTQAKVTCLHTSASGKEVTGVEVEVAGQQQIYKANIVVLAMGAVNSAILLLKSASDQHPNGLANSSGLVGRNYMAHKFGVVLALSTLANPTVFQKTMGFNDFYWGEQDFPYPMGSVQSLGNIHSERILASVPAFTPRWIGETIANHCVPWLLITEDLPNLNNRVSLKQEKIHLDYTPNNEKAFNRLIKRWIAALKSIDSYKSKQISIYHAEKMSIKEVAHQCGTCKFGEDPQTSVLDINCRAHDVDNLYVVDSSFFPSSTAINPSLTIMANALRVGEHLLTRLK
ncbi:glucose-methanol-choline oxidoreductase [Calothrix sp. NIES-4071]|nr:glucose-methanol-choline oxidoreductase [Calothrix sp. NIES-4071]BAZ58574.1 glucose-methanol-choline oxidoreductase [Calothrix sp. NIES-4105]